MKSTLCGAPSKESNRASSAQDAFEKILGFHCFMSECSYEEGYRRMSLILEELTFIGGVETVGESTTAEISAESQFKTAVGSYLRPLADGAWDYILMRANGMRRITIDLAPENKDDLAHQLQATLNWLAPLLAESETPERFDLLAKALVAQIVKNYRWEQPEGRPREISIAQTKDDLWRRAVRILAMVHELHKAGYQRIRIYPFLSPSGCNWRCWISPVTNIANDGYQLLEEDLDCRLGIVAHYTSGQDNEYLGWKDAAHLNARQLANLFLQRFPKIAEQGAGLDWAYAGWLTDVLGVGELGPENGHLVYLGQDWPDDPAYHARWRPPLPIR
ncbi:hypothetical protein KBY25_10840 [Ruegeria pomeroyi]|nr:hypothetical protein [Ruegeria pomeroyi]